MSTTTPLAPLTKPSDTLTLVIAILRTACSPPVFDLLLDRHDRSICHTIESQASIKY